MKYSVIIPAYQCENTIQDTVESVINSGLVDYEIILINDGSRDNTGMICEEIAQKHEQILYVNQENKGVSAARNRGLDLAKGQYVWFMDADDSVDENSLAKIIQIAEEYNPDMIIFGMSFDYYHHGKLYKRDNVCYPKEEIYINGQIDKHFDELYESNALTPSWNKFIRYNLLKDNNVRYLSDMFIMEDFIFSLECLKFCYSIYILPDPIYRYRQSEDEGNVYRRMRRIHDLNKFMIPFEKRLEEHQDVLNQVYFMLLNQKLWNSGIHDIRLVAWQFKPGQYVPINKNDLKLCRDLEHKRYYAIYFRNLKLRIRHSIANKIKRNFIYQKIKVFLN